MKGFFACDELTGALLHAGGTKAVFSLWVDVHLVGGRVVEHERRAGVLARGFVAELAAHLLQEDTQGCFDSGHKARVIVLDVQDLIKAKPSNPALPPHKPSEALSEESERP